jgi:hypothetical protein
MIKTPAKDIRFFGLVRVFFHHKKQDQVREIIAWSEFRVELAFRSLLGLSMYCDMERNDLRRAR